MSIPTNQRVVVKDGRSINELGKEVKAVHDLLCAIRSLGGTRKDVRNICKMRRELEALLYRSRALLPDEEPTWDIIMNLDADPGIELGQQGEMILDQRLGMWVMELNNRKGLVIGDKKIAVIHPENGQCMDRGMYDRIGLGWIDFQDLNAQAATILSEEVDLLRHLFTLTVDGDEWRDEKIFFLGTIWKQCADQKGNSGANHSWNICAKALVSNTNGEVVLSDEPLPVGKWPKNYFIAILEDLPVDKKK